MRRPNIYHYYFVLLLQHSWVSWAKLDRSDMRRPSDWIETDQWTDHVITGPVTSLDRFRRRTGSAGTTAVTGRAQGRCPVHLDLSPTKNWSDVGRQPGGDRLCQWKDGTEWCKDGRHTEARQNGLRQTNGIQGWCDVVQ